MLDRFTGAEGQNLALAALRDQPTIGGDAILAETVRTYAEIVGFNPGAMLIEESAPDNDIYFILAGKVSIKVHGREVAVRTAGQHIGEMAMLNPSQRRSTSVIAMEEVVAARLSAASFIKIADGNPRLWRNIARELADRLRQRNRYIDRVIWHEAVSAEAKAALSERRPHWTQRGCCTQSGKPNRRWRRSCPLNSGPRRGARAWNAFCPGFPIGGVRSKSTPKENRGRERRTPGGRGPIPSKVCGVTCWAGCRKIRTPARWHCWAGCRRLNRIDSAERTCVRCSGGGSSGEASWPTSWSTPRPEQRCRIPVEHRKCRW